MLPSPILRKCIALALVQAKANAYNNSEPRELGATVCITKPAIKNIVAAAGD